MSKSRRSFTGCLVGFALLCVLAVPVGLIGLQLINENLEETRQESIGTTEAKQTQSRIQTQDKANADSVEVFWVTQTAVFKARQTPTP